MIQQENTKQIMQEFMQCIKVRGKEFEPKQIKIRGVNKVKYCLNCLENKIVKMEKLNGKCPDCGMLLYSLWNKREKKNGK